MTTARWAALGCVLGLCGLHAPASAAGAVRPEQRLAVLTTAHSAYATPSTRGPVLARVSARRPITGARTVLPVLGRAAGPGGRRWLRVRLPGRVLGGDAPPPTAWIRASATRPSRTRWHLVVDLAGRRVRAYRGGGLVMSFPAIVGRRSTPTPVGEFFVEENVHLPGDRAGAPFALATSARSSVLQEFDGGPGQIALHGRRHVGGRLGSAVSHGCVRLALRPITRLAAVIGPGTPVSVLGATRRSRAGLRATPRP